MATEVPNVAAAVLRPSFPCVGADLEAARACELTVFSRRFGNTAAELEAEYGRYESTTSFGAVLRPDGTAVAAFRLIRPGSRGLKTLNDASGRPWGLPVDTTSEAAGIDPATTWDVGTFGVDTSVAGPGPATTLALWSVFFGAFRDNDVTSFVAILDEGARRPMAALGVAMVDLPGAVPSPYLGSAASTPVYRHVRDLHDLHHARSADVHPQVFHGHGIDGMDADSCRPGAFGLRAA